MFPFCGMRRRGGKAQKCGKERDEWRPRVPQKYNFLRHQFMCIPFFMYYGIICRWCTDIIEFILGLGALPNHTRLA